MGFAERGCMAFYEDQVMQQMVGCKVRARHATYESSRRSA